MANVSSFSPALKVKSPNWMNDRIFQGSLYIYSCECYNLLKIGDPQWKGEAPLFNKRG